MKLTPDAEGKKKFSEGQINLKTNIRLTRLEQGYTIAEFAKAIGVGRKKYEDIEALRAYGCFVSWDVVCACSDVLGVTLDSLRG